MKETDSYHASGAVGTASDSGCLSTAFVVTAVALFGSFHLLFCVLLLARFEIGCRCSVGRKRNMARWLTQWIGVQFCIRQWGERLPMQASAVKFALSHCTLFKIKKRRTLSKKRNTYLCCTGALKMRRMLGLTHVGKSRVDGTSSMQGEQRSWLATRQSTGIL